MEAGEVRQVGLDYLPPSRAGLQAPFAASEKPSCPRSHVSVVQLLSTRRIWNMAGNLGWVDLHLDIPPN